MSSAKELIETIKADVEKKGRTAASQKDEVAFMRAMVNDRDFKVQVYDRNGPTDEYVCPSENARSIGVNTLMSTTHMSKDEATGLMNGYEYSNKDAENFVGISKEFVSNYLNTGRKLSLGMREKSNISLSRKVVAPSTSATPVKTGEIDENGKEIWTTKTTHNPGHESIKVHAPHPPYIK